MPQTIIFDKDGTLFDFTRTWGPWCADLLRDIGRDEAHAAALGRAVGFDLARQCYAKDSPVIAGTPDTSAERMLPLLPDWSRDALIAHMLAAPVTPAPVCDLGPLLDELREAGHVLTVMTNDSEDAAREQLEGLGVADRFALIVGYDSGFGQKPDPAPLLEIARAIGTPPGRCVMVGDSMHDVHAGQAAGMRTIAVLTGVAGARDLGAAGEIATDIRELPRLLARTG